MYCPKCKSEITEVKETRASRLETTRRRRCCLRCKHKFTTYEVHAEVFDHDKRLELLRRRAERLAAGMEALCRDLGRNP